MPIDYSKFDRLVAASEEEDLKLEETRKRAAEDLDRRHREDQKAKDIEKLRCAEQERRRGAGDKCAIPHVNNDDTPLEIVEAGCGIPVSQDPPMKMGKAVVQSRAACKDFEKMTQEDLENMDVDDFFRPLTLEEKEQRQRLKEEATERRIQKEEASGKRPLREKGMTPEQVVARIAHLEKDMTEMVALMERSDRPAVKARLGEFVVEMSNELARLREDPLELDDEDRHELRLFQLRRYQLPGAARCVVDETAYKPKAIDAAALDVCHQPPWHELTTYALELGDAETPFVTIDVRVEAVERLPKDAVACHFTEDAFDLQIRHDLAGIRYRLRKTCLQYDIYPEQSHFAIKRNHVIISLAKTVASQNASDTDTRYRKFPLWSDLCAVDKHARNRTTLERPD